MNTVDYTRPPTLRVNVRWDYPKLSAEAWIASVGSCFSAELASELFACGFHGAQNPNGILYNPVSIADALERCRKARLEILNEVKLPCIAEPRPEVSEYAPKMLSLKIPVDKIREGLGSGGKTIQKICADTGAKVDIEDDGSVFISAVDSAAAYAAKKMVDDICFVPEVGKLYYGKVVRILPIGAFVEIAPGHDGMVHISKLENRRVEKVEDVLNLGDMTGVKFMGFDEKRRANFSRKDALKEMANNG